MGKLIGMGVGAVVGLALGHIWWAVMPLVGIAIGHYVDSQIGFTDPDDPALSDRGATRGELDLEAQLRFARSMAALFVLVAEVDGEMTRAEAGAIRDFFADNLGFRQRELEVVRVALQEARKHPADLEVVLYAARERLSDGERSLLLYALASVAAADHPLRASEAKLLQQIGIGLNLDRDVIAAMLRGHQQRTERKPAEAPRKEKPKKEKPEKKKPEPKAAPKPEPEPQRAPPPDDPVVEEPLDPYAKLGLTEKATDAEVKAAFRALAQKLHPDKVQNLGKSAVELASRAFSEVSEAYETIRRDRNL